MPQRKRMKVKQPKLRSVFSTVNLGGSVHRTKKGAGSYRRKDRNGNRFGN